MSEAIIIKCRVCKQSFRKDEIGLEPVVLKCRCENITIEVQSKENEDKKMFLVKYKNDKPLIKVR
tara:strand:+ start:346 stop:540 length:195 start_codon:yes stop_codon:yes gene_type:complete